MRSLKKLFAGVVLASGMVLAQQAAASTLVYTASFDHWPGAYEGGAVPLSALWPQFDPSLGTLTGVEYDLVGLMHYYVTKLTDDHALIHYSLSSGLTLNGTGLSFKSPGETANFDAIYNWGSSGGPSLTDASAGTTITADFGVDIMRTPDLGLGTFVGTGTVNLTVSRSIDNVCYRLDEQPGVTCGTGGYSTASMTYTFDPAPRDSGLPEPASAAVLLAGLIGLRVRKRG